MKGVSPFISYALVLLLAVSSLALIMFVAVPVLDRARDSSVINEAQSNLQKLDGYVREIASEASGSIRKISVGVTGGQYRVDNSSGQLIFTFDTKSGIVPFGANSKQGNIQISGGGLVTATVNSTDLVLDNGVLLLDFPNVTSAGYNQEKPTLIRNKLNSISLNLVNFSVSIGSQPFYVSSSGIVQTGVVSKGTAYFKGTSAGNAYTLLYTLPAGVDWFQVQLKNLSSSTNASFTYNFSLGTTATNDVINIANQTSGSILGFVLNLTLALNQTNTSVYLHGSGATGYLTSSVNMTNSTLSNNTVTGYNMSVTSSGNVINYTVMLDSDNSTSVNNLLNISGLANIGVYYNASDGTWRNVSELGNIGQGYWNLNGTSLNYTLGGADGYDYGIRDALVGGSYWLNESGIADDQRASLSSNIGGGFTEPTIIKLSNDFVTFKQGLTYSPNAGVDVSQILNNTGSIIFETRFGNLGVSLDGTALANTLYSIYSGTNQTVYFFDWKDNAWKVWQKSNYTNNLVGHWKFDEGQTSNTADSSEQGNAGTLGNSTTGTAPTWITNSSCRFGSCLNFNSSQFVNVSSSSSLNIANAITIDAWIKGSVDSTEHPIVSKTDEDTSTGYRLILNSGNGIGFYTLGVSDVYTSTSTTLASNQWYHVVATYDGSNKKIYINGQLDVSEAGTGSISTNSNSLYIGQRHNPPILYFNGSIDDVKIWNRSLSATEVQAEYQNTKRGMPDWTDPRFKQEFKWMQQLKRDGYPSINYTYLMTAHDPFVRIFADSDATIFADNFDSEGDNVSPAKWSVTETSPVNLVRTNSTVYQGTSGKSVRLNLSSSQSMQYNHPQTTKASYEFYVRPEQTSEIFEIDVRSGSTNAIRLDFDQPNNLIFRTGGSWATLMTWNANQWYKIRLDVDADTDTTVIYVDDVLKNASAQNAADVGYIDNLHFENSYGDSWAGVFFVDNVKITPRHNITIPVSFGQDKSYTYMKLAGVSNGWNQQAVSSTNPWFAINDSVGWTRTDGTTEADWTVSPLFIFVNRASGDQPLFMTHNYQFGKGKHSPVQIRIENASSATQFGKATYYYLFNASSNNNFLFSLGYPGTIDTSANCDGLATCSWIDSSSWQFSNETIGQVANSTLTYYDLHDNKLVGWWKFNENNNTIADYSGFNNTGTGYNGMQILTNSSCKTNFGYCAAFDGNNDYIRMTTMPTSFNAITVSTWVKFNQVNTNNYLVLDSSEKYILSVFNDKLRFDAFDTADRITDGTTTITTGQWYHLVGTYDGNKVRVYVNGVDDQSTPTLASGPISPSSTMDLGGKATVYLNGLMDNVKIYSRVLSPDEISWEYNEQKENYPNWFKANQTNGATNIATTNFNYDGGAVGVWHFDEGSGSIAADSSGNGNSGTLVNSPNITWPGSFSCKYGSCLNFTGSNGYVWLGQDKFTTAQTAKGTIEMWFNPATLSPSFQYLADF
ncbi:LamG domain-containing protein, partial [archaeon]